MFARHGIPKVVFGDNSPEFDSLEYKGFSKRWDFVHDTSALDFHGAMVKLKEQFKQLKEQFKKAAASHQDPHLVLLAIRTTPVKGQVKSSAFILNRHPRTLLPSVKTPKPSRIKKSKSPYKHHHDKGAKDLPPLGNNKSD